MASGLKKAAAKQPNITGRIAERLIDDPNSSPCKTLGKVLGFAHDVAFGTR